MCCPDQSSQVRPFRSGRDETVCPGKELIRATVFFWDYFFSNLNKITGQIKKIRKYKYKYLIDNTEQLTTLKDTCVVARKSIEVVLTLWNLGKTSGKI